MNKHNSHSFKRLLAAGLCGLGLWAGSAAAHGEGPGHRAHELDLRGDRIERRLDRKGDRIERRLKRLARELRAEGRWAEARRLERKGHMINHRLDRKGEHINRRLDREARRLRQEYRHGRLHDHPVYRSERRRHHDHNVTLALDLGHWLIRP